MFFSKCVAAAAVLLVSAPAWANPTTDAITKSWNYTAPNNPNSPTPTPVAAGTIYCPAGLSPVQGVSGIYCEGVPAGQFVTAGQAPTNYSGRVFEIGPLNGSGHQSLGW